MLSTAQPAADEEAALSSPTAAAVPISSINNPPASFLCPLLAAHLWLPPGALVNTKLWAASPPRRPAFRLLLHLLHFHLELAAVAVARCIFSLTWMFVQSESFDLFTAQVLHFTRHSPPITCRCRCRCPRRSWTTLSGQRNAAPRRVAQLCSFTHHLAALASLGRGNNPQCCSSSEKRKNRNAFLQILIAHVSPLPLHGCASVCMRICH